MSRNRKSNFMTRFAGFIVDKRKLFFAVFLGLCVFCVFSRNWVQVNDRLTDYLGEETETRRGLELMEREFTTYAVAQIMVQNISYDQADALLPQIEGIEGVKSVLFDETPEHYASSSALFTVTFDGTNDDEASIRALAEVEQKLSSYDLYVNSQVGNPLKAIINREMLVVDLIAVVIIVLVLLFTSRTYAEIPVLLITFGAAALLNMGTNYLMGEISFVTNAIAIVLQLALAIDYAIILCHRYMEEHVDKPPREAAIAALSKAIPEISASSLTTVSGLLALTFMQFRLGFDMGVVLIKAILLSLCAVFLLMPGLLVAFAGAIDRTHHKSFVPKISFLGRYAYATRFVVPILFAAVLAGAYFCSHNAHYVYDLYSVRSIRQNDTQIAREQIIETFGANNQIALLVPAGDYEKEAELITEIRQLPQTVSVTGLAGIEANDDYLITSALTPRQFAEMTDLDYEVARVLYTGYAMEQDDYGQAATNIDNYRISLIDLFTYLNNQRDSVTINLPDETEEKLDDLKEELDDARLQLQSENWSRIVVEVDLPTEAEESYEYLNILRGIAARFYSEHFLVGDTTSCYDLRSSFEHDNLLISILTVFFVVAVLIFTFRSVGLPVLLIVIIQGSIWCNFSPPFLNGRNLYFLTYLIISAIQMGANIDYAIVISSRYLALKKELPLKEAMVETLNQAFPTIITSGTILASAGMAIGLMTSNETISAIGVYLGTGTLISIFLVMCVLPQILLLGDLLISRTSFELSPAIKVASRQGMMRIDGRVRGTMNGYFDAEVHGVFRGTMSAIVDINNVEEMETPGLDESGAQPTEDGVNRL